MKLEVDEEELENLILSIQVYKDSFAEKRSKASKKMYSELCDLEDRLRKVYKE